MADVQDEMINNIDVKGQTLNNAFGALGITIIFLDKENLRSIIQHSKSLDFSLWDSSRLERESNYQMWLFRMAKILERHHIWTLCVNPKTQGVILEAEHEGKKLALNATSKSMQNSLILIIKCYTDPYKYWKHLKG